MIKGDFLTDEQKQIKQDIMESLIDSLFGTLQRKGDKFNEQAMADVIFSCLVMFARESLCKFIVASNNIENAVTILMQFNVTVALEVHEMIEKYLDNNGQTH